MILSKTGKPGSRSFMSEVEGGGMEVDSGKMEMEGDRLEVEGGR